MIGENYLHLRAQLGAAIFSLGTLARDLDAEEATLDLLHGLSERLREPLLLVALGENGAGKSSLLNALVGREFCALDENIAPLRLFTFGPESADEAHSGFIEARRPHGFLREFNVLDTPGVNVLSPEDWETLGRFLPRADAILVVFSVTNPWASAAWEAAQFMAKNWPEKIALVLQQADLREPVEVAAIAKHIEQTAREKLGVNRPVFAISAKKALRAKTTASEKARLLSESGIDRLEAFLSDAILKGDSSLARLRASADEAEKTLNAIGRKVREAMLALKKENDRLCALQQKLQDRREQSLRSVGGTLWTLAQTCEMAQKRGEEWLQKIVSIPSALKMLVSGANWPGGLREEIEVRLREALEKQTANSVDLLQSDLQSVWKELHGTLANTYGHEALQPPDFARQRENLIRCIDLSFEPHLMANQLEIELPILYQQMAAWLRMPLGFALASGLAAVAAVFAQISLAPILGAIAAGAAVFGIVMAASKRNRLLSIYRETMVQKREAMLAPIEDHMRHSIDIFYKSLPATFELLHGFCLTQQQIYEPLHTRLQELSEIFAQLARDLGMTVENKNTPRV